MIDQIKVFVLQNWFILLLVVGTIGGIIYRAVF